MCAAACRREGEFEWLVNIPLMVVGDVDHCAEKISRVALVYGFDEMLC